MPSFKEIKKYCGNPNCVNLLVLNCTRDIERKKYCSKSCSTKMQVKTPESNAKRSKAHLGIKNPKKGNPGILHPSFGKKLSIETRSKMSNSISLKILNGDNFYNTNHKTGYIECDKFCKNKIFYRSSYELHFLKLCIEDNNVKYVKSSPFRIKYNDVNHYIPDFLVTLIDESQILFEVKPKRRIPENTSKFNSAIDYCNNHNLKFRIFTEDNIKKLQLNYA